MGSIFNEYEKRFIDENYSCMTNKEISEHLGRDERQIRGYANNKGLKKSTYSPRYDKDKTDYILKWYNIKSNKEISDDIGLTQKQVNDYGYRHVGKLSGYTANYSYFEKIDNEHNAYWLGFLYADGCVLDYVKKSSCNFKSLEFCLAEQDVGHMHKFNESLMSTYKISKKVVNGFGNCRICIGNTKLCDDLIKLGCTPRKSLTLKFPSEDIVPAHLVRHFIRGYFDGDGCVSYSSDKAKRKAYKVGFVGTSDMCNNIMDILNTEAGMTKIKTSPCGKALQFMWGGRINCKKVYNYLYSDATIYLDRKYEKFNKIINYEV